ncbi:hypothetical protein GAGA_0552 [Paraglaciecola agarilytica NO2]|uniref:Uncharacterized protein n=1 Tax=Paraglaciecola agarilytica NO2 TaxID=1125747 RepID=A0ABQ0I292_9ALTE|nr:hypothetical protein GAGA_0552 [Paraglaciecola agarilytica NO2]
MFLISQLFTRLIINKVLAQNGFESTEASSIGVIDSTFNFGKLTL